MPEPAYYGRRTADLTAEELRDYEALAYEIEMLGEVSRLIAGQPHSPHPLKNALIESFALHFRNLASFLWPTRSPKRDVQSFHFITGRRWTPSKPRGLAKRVEQASREVAHLTTFRLPGEHPRKRWEFAECIRTLLPALEEFVRQADATKLSPRVSQEVRQLRALADDSPVRVKLETANFTTSITRPLEVR